MPELPEVETIARDLRGLLVGKRLISATVHWPGAIARPALEAFHLGIHDRTVVGVCRRGKYLVIGLAKCCPSTLREDVSYLHVHLGMTGQLRSDVTRCAESPHIRVILEFCEEKRTSQNGHDAHDHLRLHYIDQRKFGRFHLASDPSEVTRHLGPEPLSPEFSSAWLARAVRGRSRRIKPLLLDQHFLAGLGNIYVDEALFVARLHPLRPADSLSPPEVVALHQAIDSVLRQAIANRGTTLEDYRDGRGRPGENQHSLRVVRRKGEPCPCCSGKIERIVVEGRGTYLCSNCQSLVCGTRD